ncbi:tetratricopeptide repeat protein [Kitasatospora sp. NPDC088391]|uniref:tetratricopeptide repeat protein n=1 Tax=Kitasatospora sp. NPDC088391 TaxID=3364074 RepID=UPI00380C0630
MAEGDGVGPARVGIEAGGERSVAAWSIDRVDQSRHYYGAPGAPDPLVTVSTAAPLGIRDAAAPLRGRDGLLAAVGANLRAPGAGRLVVLSGMGGCGKTSLALEIAAGHPGRVWWVDARSESVLEASLRAVARQAGADPGQLAHGDAADVLWSALGRLRDPWLLVVDNADAPALLDGPGRLAAGTGWLRPTTGAGAVLVTTRDGAPATWGPGARHHRVGPLTEEVEGGPDAAAQILLDRTGPAAGSPAEARALAARLGGLPLALHLAGTYLARTLGTPPAYRAADTPVTFAAYHSTWNTGGPATLDHSQSLARTWSMSVALLEERGHPHARDLLELIASFADADLPYTLLLTPDRLPHLDGPTLWAHLTALESVGFLTFSTTGSLPLLRMHPLVRDASHTPPTETTVRLLVDAVLSEETGYPDDPSTWSMWQALAPHVLAAFHHPQGLRTVELAKAAHFVTNYLHQAGLLRQARAEFETLLATRRELLGDDHSDTLTTRHNLAGTMQAQGHLQQAQTELETILAVRRELLGDDHPSTLTTRHNLAFVLQAQGHLQQARTEFEIVLAMEREILGDDHPDTLTTRHSLASVLQDQGHLPQARTEFEIVLAMEREVLGDDHPSTLTTRHNLAGVLYDQGHLRQAQIELEAVLAVRRELLGDNHPHTLTARHNLAQILWDRGHRQQAGVDFEAVLAARRELLGDDHPHTVLTRDALTRLSAEPRPWWRRFFG